MTRINLEHIIRAVGDILDTNRITIFGSQSILAQHPDLDNIVKSKNVNLSPKKGDISIMQVSMEADILMENTQLADQLEFDMGEQSQFHKTHGYYVDTIDIRTSKLPHGWEDRLIEICNQNTNGVSGWCLEKHDLILSKLYANRPKDIDFFNSAISLSLLKKKPLLKRLKTMNISDQDKQRIKDRIEGAF